MSEPEVILETDDLEPVPEERLPVPVGYRMLVEMIPPKTKTSGGILLSDKSVDAQMFQRFVGKVVRLGPLCFLGNKAKYGDTPWCKPGDWVVFGAYTGERIEIMGHHYRFVNDDQIMAVTDDPAAIKIYVD